MMKKQVEFFSNVLAGVVPASFPRIVNSGNFSYGYLLTIRHEWFNSRHMVYFILKVLMLHATVNQKSY